MLKKSFLANLVLFGIQMQGITTQQILSSDVLVSALQKKTEYVFLTLDDHEIEKTDVKLIKNNKRRLLKALKYIQILEKQPTDHYYYRFKALCYKINIENLLKKAFGPNWRTELNVEN